MLSLSLVKTESSKLSDLKDCQSYLDQGYKIPNVHAGKITENINKLTKHMNLRNKSSLELKLVFKTYKNINIKSKLLWTLKLN